jgi:hypothetical protein
MKKLNHTLFVLFFTCFILFVPANNLLAATGASPAISASGAAVIVHQDYDGTGTSQTLYEGTYDMAVLENGVGSDEISSITVPNGYVVTIYTDQAFHGAIRVLTQSCMDLSTIGMNDKISSMSIRKMPSEPVVSAYDNSDYQGSASHLLPGEYDFDALVQGVGNDKISSLRIASGYRVTLYENYNFGGNIKVLTQDTANLKSIGFNDETTSLMVEPLPLSPIVTIYSDTDYNGKNQEFYLGEYDVDILEQGIGNDSLSSLRIQQGYQVTLFTNNQYGGNSFVYSQDCAYVGGSFHDSVSSLRIEAINPLDDTCINITNLNDNRKAEVATAFAPRIWMAQGETYMPSTVEHALANTTRTWMPSTNSYWYVTNETLNDSSTKLPYFNGDLENAKIYAFWTEKAFSNVDISYFQFSPYNRGKTVVGSEFGNHVGDWEHITVRFARFSYEGEQYLKPIQVVLPAHSFRNIYDWAQMDKVGGTHVVAYNALESHGMWKDAGNHVYQNIVVAQLTDICNQGTAWDTWNSLRIFEYNAWEHTGRGIGTETWPSYFNNDYSNPNSLSAQYWGNPQQGSLFGQPLLSNGPSGPEGKAALNHHVMLD